ncbi:MAG: hypothetical protein ACK5XV_09530 [Flavobacteriales bacterium]|jgi:hypothetical protein
MVNWFKLFSRRKRQLPQRTDDEIKRIVNILFIDDQRFKIVDTLKRSGWPNVDRIQDVETLDDPKIKNAHILFVDIQGVGKKMQLKEEGLELIIALKSRYPYKRIIAYSAEHQGKVEAFHRALNFADSRLSKNASLYEFQTIIQRYSREILSHEYFISRLQEILRLEFNVSMERDELVSKLNIIQRGKDYSPARISDIFKVSSAADFATIIQLFLTGA